MAERSFIHDPPPEDRLTLAKRARGVAIVYGSILSLLIGIFPAQRISAEPSRDDIDVAAASATPIELRAS